MPAEAHGMIFMKYSRITEKLSRFSLNMALSLCVLLITASLQVSAKPLFTTAAEPQIIEWTKQLLRVKEWRMRFRYTMDVHFKNDFGGLGEEEKRKVEASGTALFKLGKQRYEYEGSGQTTYDLEYYSFSFMKDYKILDVEKGSGTAPLIKEACSLTFNFDDLTYSFSIFPGSGEGVPSRSFRKSNITDALIAEMGEAGKPVLYPEKLKAMFPDEQTWDEFTSFLGVEAFGMPLPFFGLTLAGSYTDSQGSVVSWILEPTSQDEERKDKFEVLTKTENWFHFHPPEADYQNQVVSLWPEVLKKVQELDAIDSGSEALNAGINVYLVKENDNGHSGLPISTGDSLVAIDLSQIDDAENSISQTSEDRGSFALKAIETETAGQMDQNARRKAALYALFYGDTGNLGNELINPVQSHPLLLDTIEIQANTIIVRMWGRIEGAESIEMIRVREQIEHTVTQGEGDINVRILLNDKIL